MSEETRRGRPRKYPIAGVSLTAEDPELPTGQAGEGAEQLAAVPSIAQDIKTETENKELIELQAVIDSLAEKGGFARIYLRGDFGSQQYLAEIPISSFSLEYIKQEFGGGDFLAQFLTSEKKFFKRFEFQIPKFFIGRAQRAATEPKANGNGGGGVMLAQAPDQSGMIISLMNQQKAESAQLFQLMLSMQQETTKGMFMVLAKMFEGGGRRSGPQESTTDFITAAMPLLLENMKPKTATGDLLDNVEKLAKLKEFFGDMAGEKKDDEDMLEKLLKVGGPLVGALMAKAAGPRPINLPGAQVSASPPQFTEQAPAPMPPAQAIPEPAIQQLRLALPLLVNAAHKNSPPESYFDLVADNMPDPAFDELIGILETPTWRATLFDNDPRIEQDPVVIAWLERLRQVFLNSVEPETQAATTQAPEPTDPNEPAT